MVHVTHQRREVIGHAGCFAPQRGLQAGHGQGRGDAFTGNIANGNPQLPAGQRQKIIIIAAYTKSGTASASVVNTIDSRQLLWEEALLYLAGDFDFSVQAFALSDPV